MFPVLFSIGKFSVSSFGVLLALGFLEALFLVWRLSRAWDLDEEKTLDLTLLIFLGGLIGARLIFAIEHWQLFAPSLLQIILFTKFPGFSYGGSFLGALLTMYYFTKRFKMDFWQIADIASVGLLGGLIWSSLGCFLGGCGIGIQSHAFFAVSMVGVLGKRFPVQLLEAFLFLLILQRVWSIATHFHQRGKIAGISLFCIGLTNILTSSLKQIHTTSLLFSISLTICGAIIFYRRTKRNPMTDLKNFLFFPVKIIIDSKVRISVLASIKKTWYNQKTSISWKIRSLKKNLRRINVRISRKTN